MFFGEFERENNHTLRRKSRVSAECVPIPFGSSEQCLHANDTTRNTCPSLCFEGIYTDTFDFSFLFFALVADGRLQSINL